MIIKPMLAESLPNTADLDSYVGTHVAQRKYDGTRVLIHKARLEVVFKTRSEKTNLTQAYSTLAREVLKWNWCDTCILDAELVMTDANGCVKFLTAKAKESTRAGLTPTLIVFDVLFHNGADFRDKSFRIRDGLLEAWLPETASIKKAPTFHDGFQKLYNEEIACGGEGIMLKDKSAIYRHDGLNHNRGKGWLKVKKDETADCFVLGLQRGNGKTSGTFGALVLGQWHNNQVVEVGRASGMTDAERRALYDEIMPMPNFPGPLPGQKKADGSLIKVLGQKWALVVEIKFQERTKAGKLRHPRFVRRRTDKLPRECEF